MMEEDHYKKETGESSAEQVHVPLQVTDSRMVATQKEVDKSTHLGLIVERGHTSDECRQEVLVPQKVARKQETGAIIDHEQGMLQINEIKHIEIAQHETSASTNESPECRKSETRKGSIKTLQQEKEALKQELEVLRKASAQQSSRDEADKEELQNENEALQYTNRNLQSTNQDLHNALSLERQKSHTLAKKVTSLTRELQMLKQLLNQRLSQAEAHFTQALAPQQIPLSRIKFGKAEWERYFGDVGTEPGLPTSIGHICNMPCPFWPDRKVGETHLLVLVPSTVNGVPFTLNLLGELIRSPRNGGHATRFKLYDHRIEDQLGGKQGTERSYWLLMTRSVLPGSQSKDCRAQRDQVNSLSHGTLAHEQDTYYTIPRTLEAATAILAHYVRSGERLYSDEPTTYTRCLEQINEQYPASVGCFSSEGLYIYHVPHTVTSGIGISCLQRIENRI